MSQFASLFSWNQTKSSENLPDIFPIPIIESIFVSIDVQNIYTRIITDVFERTQGITDELKPLLWDNCLGSEKQDGLVSLIAKAMVDKKELFLVYRPDLKIIRVADQAEAQKIRDDYKARGESSTGVYITFKNYVKSDMVKFYSLLEYCAVGGLWKQSNLSKAIEVKINELRSTVSLNDSTKAINQAKNIAKALGEGKDVLMDAKDIIETLTPDLTATNSTLELISRKHSFYLGLPASYFNGYGETSKMSDTGKADSKATERGLKSYYFSIVKPVTEALLRIKTTFKSDDTEMLDTGLKTIETFDRTSDEYLSKDNKTLIVNKVFGLDEDEVGDEPQPDPNLDPNSKTNLFQDDKGNVFKQKGDKVEKA